MLRHVLSASTTSSEVRSLNAAQNCTTSTSNSEHAMNASTYTYSQWQTKRGIARGPVPQVWDWTGAPTSYIISAAVPDCFGEGRPSPVSRADKKQKDFF